MLCVRAWLLGFRLSSEFDPMCCAVLTAARERAVQKRYDERQSSHRVLKGRGFKGRMYPKCPNAPHYSPRLPKLPEGFPGTYPTYLPPMNPPPLRNLSSRACAVKQAFSTQELSPAGSGGQVAAKVPNFEDQNPQNSGVRYPSYTVL